MQASPELVGFGRWPLFCSYFPMLVINQSKRRSDDQPLGWTLCSEGSFPGSLRVGVCLAEQCTVGGGARP